MEGARPNRTGPFSGPHQNLAKKTLRCASQRPVSGFGSSSLKAPKSSPSTTSTCATAHRPWPPPLYADRLTVDSPSSGLFPPLDSGHRSLPPSPRQRHFGHTPPRTHLVVNTMTPPGTPPMRRRNKVKAPGTPPPPSRKLIHLLPGFTALHRSKSHEFQLGNRLDDTQTPNMCKGYYSWTRWPDLMSTSSWMRLASTCRNEGKEAVTSLAKEPSLRSLANGGLVHRHAVLGSYNTQRLLTFLEELKDILLDRQQHHPGPAHHIYVIIWDNVCFHRTNQIREWFTTNSDHFLNVCLPPYSPFLNPIEEFFSSWRWKVYDRQPYTRENLLRAMELACVDIPAEAFQGWIRHSRAFFQRCLARYNIACDVDEQEMLAVKDEITREGFQTLVRYHHPTISTDIIRAKKKTKPLNLKIHSSVGSCENLPTQRSPLHTERSLRSFFFPSFIPSTPPVHAETPSANTLSVPRWSPQIPRRDLGNSIKHRFSTKYWMSQTCIVCGKGMLFGLKCKNCKLKCHNKCTKEAPPCHLLIIQRGGRESLKDHQGITQVARLVRTESVPCDINNPLRYTDLHISQTLPKTNKINKDHIPVPYQPDSSSNPSSTTSSTPSSPAPPLPSSATPPSPLHPSPQSARQQKQFNLTASSYFKYKQQFIFPDVAPEAPPSRAPQVILHPVLSEPGNEGNPLLQIEVEPTSDNEEGNDEDSGDEFEEMNLSLLSARNFPRKASQTSIFLQEWDIPFEQLEIGEMIGKGRFGKVFHGRWHGEVAIRLIDIERDNEDQLKAFKREVMAYRNTRHENVVLFMGACMSPPHLAIITSFCKGRTLYSVVRDAKVVLDVNKTRQIAQEMVKGMGYLHAKGILHKDMKSKNVFYDNGKVVITDFGLFTISGVLQAGSRREDKLRIPNGWLCHLAPEIIQQLSPETEEDKLPFSKQSDVFAFGTIWYELHAREWPYKSQPAEVIIWQIGSGMKPNLAQTGMGKEILVRASFFSF
ncbi:unnamed protein product [Oreochromis niloticus]|nr:unnamed protein product [Mustela putorius furo]